MSSAEGSRMLPSVIWRIRPVWTVAVAALVGCSTCPPFRAGWYLHDPVASAASAPDAAASGIYLALLHQGKEAVSLKQVVINPTGSDADGVVVSPAAREGAGEVWKPGQLRLFHFDKDFETCSLPVAVRIECDQRCSRTESVSGALPNYLHDAWLKQCLRPAASSSPALKAVTPP